MGWKTAGLLGWRLRSERRPRRGTRRREFEYFGLGFRDKTRGRIRWYNALDRGRTIPNRVLASLALHLGGHTLTYLARKPSCDGASIKQCLIGWPRDGPKQLIRLFSFSFTHFHALPRRLRLRLGLGLTKCVMCIDLGGWFTRPPNFGGTTTSGGPSPLVCLFFSSALVSMKNRTRYMALSIDQDLSVERVHDARRRTRVYRRSNRGTVGTRTGCEWSRPSL